MAARSFDQLARQPAEEPGEELLLVSSAAVPPTRAERSNLGDRAATARSTGQTPRRETRKGRTLPPLVSVPSKSNAATVLGGFVAGASTRGLRLRGKIGHERFTGSLKCGAAPPRAAGEAQGTLERLAAVDDGAPAAGLVHGRLVLGHSPLLQHRHAIRT